MSMTRKDFLTFGLQITSAALATALMPGCSDDGSDGGSGGGAGSGGSGGTSGGGCMIDIALNHGHVLLVTAADVSAGVDKSYDIVGAAAHTHQVTVSAQDFGKLAAGESVMLTSSETAAHSHTITVICA